MFLLGLYLFIALFFSFLCSIAEAVLLSVSWVYIASIEGQGKKSAVILRELKADINKPLAAILTLNTVSHTVGAAGVGAQATVVFGDASLGIVSAVLTLLILIFSEIIPKTLGASYWRRLAPVTAHSLKYLIGGDRDQLRKIARGVCDVAIANSYYYGMLSASVKQSDRDVYRQIGIVLPSNNGVGAHVNISGAAVTRAAKNKANAIRFVEFLTTEKAQKIYADINYEYPVRHNTLAAELLTSWGVLNADLDSILQLTKYHEESKAIISKYRW